MKDDELEAVAKLFISIATKAVKYSTELIEEKIEKQNKQERMRQYLDILEYQEDAKRRKNIYTPNEGEEDRIVEKIKLKDPDFNKEMFERFTQDVFEKLQKAYCSNTLNSVRKYVDINILERFNTQAMQNAYLEETEEIDILEFNFVDFFGYHIENNMEIVSVAISMVLYDFVKDKDGNIIRGSDKIKNREVYILSFARRLGGKTINNLTINDDGLLYCPNCGSKITSSYNECEHCKTVLYNSTENWLLNYIESL